LHLLHTSRVPDPIDELRQRYAQPQRHYHTLAHVEAVLRHLRHLCAPDPIPRDVELAAWFHDAVYEPTRNDNEVQSAELARQLLSASGERPSVIEEVRRLVLLTRTHAPSDDDRNGAVLCDADLAILAAAPQEYDDYAAQIRAEYSHVPADAFVTGRAQVLERFLARPRIFHTTRAYEAWEGRARANVEREVEELRRQTSAS